jgi:hypothetical protein
MSYAPQLCVGQGFGPAAGLPPGAELYAQSTISFLNRDREGAS